MTGWVKLTNTSTWITNQDLICCICNNRFRAIVETIKDKRYCIQCFSKNIIRIFQDNDFITIRGLEDIEFENKKQNFPKTLNKSLRYFILKRDDFKCTACGKSGKEILLHVDHIIPKKKHGLNNLDNLRTLCIDCNLGKGARW